MMLRYSTGMSLQKYSGASGGTGSKSSTSEDSVEATNAVVAGSLSKAGWLSKAEVNNDNVSGLPHCKR